jgi:hypothetical protein
MYIDPLALKRLEEGGLPSHPLRDAKNRVHTQSGSTTAPASIKHHRPQHLHLPNIIDHSIAICPTSSITALSSAHCHHHKFIRTPLSDNVCRVRDPTFSTPIPSSQYYLISDNIISRRPAQSRAQRPFYRIAIDLIYIIPVGEECIDGSKYASHSMDEYSKWHEIATIKRKDKLTLTRLYMALIRKIQRVYNADVVAIRCDNE